MLLFQAYTIILAIYYNEKELCTWCCVVNLPSYHSEAHDLLQIHSNRDVHETFCGGHTTEVLGTVSRVMV